MKLAPISAFDVAAQQAWLEDEAARGNFLLTHNGYWARFEKEEPKTVRYRLEPMRKKEDAPEWERRELYASLGWDYVCTMGDLFHIWRCDDPSVPELDTDPQMQAAAYTRLRKQLKIANWICSAIIALPILFGIYLRIKWAGIGVELPHRWLPLWRFAVVMAALILVWGQGIYWQISLRRYLRTLEAGIPAPCRRPYQKSRMLTALTLVVYAAALVVQTINVFEPDNRSFEPVAVFDESVPYVEIAGAEEVEAIRWKNWKTREQWWVIQVPWVGPHAESHYYDFWTTRKAEKTARDLAKMYKMTLVEQDSIDGVWQMRHEERDYQMLVIWDGTRVMEVTYSGPEEIISYLDDYTALVTE